MFLEKGRQYVEVKKTCNFIKLNFEYFENIFGLQVDRNFYNVQNLEKE